VIFEPVSTCATNLQLKAQQEQPRSALAARHIILNPNVAAAAHSRSSLTRPNWPTRELITINTNILDTLREQFERGYVSWLDAAAYGTGAFAAAHRWLAGEFCPGNLISDKRARDQ
jgi:hypothetical protein